MKDEMHGKIEVSLIQTVAVGRKFINEEYIIKPRNFMAASEIGGSEWVEV